MPEPILSDEQVNQYKEEGYCVYPRFLSESELAALLQETTAASAGASLAHHDSTRVEMEPTQPPEGTRVRRLYEPCEYYARCRALSESGKLLDAVEQLLGPNLRFHYSKLNMKPPEIGSVVEWHQDLAYYPLTNRDSLAILFYLDDADVTNGCLKVLPGMHLGRVLDHTRDGYFQGRVTEPIDESKAVAAPGPAGTAIFMNGMTPHSSAPNSSDRARRTLILSYRAADAYLIYFGENTPVAEAVARHVRGEPFPPVRFFAEPIPVPRQRQQSKSLYELQESSRRQEKADS